MESLVVCCSSMKWRRALDPSSADTASIRNTFFGESSYCYRGIGQSYYSYSGYTSGWQSYFILRNDSGVSFTCEYRIRYYL